jgi:RimJ/RimL family protein N-acetyltransferase
MTPSRIFATKPTIVGKRATLRPFTQADVEAMGPILADPQMLRLTGSVHTTAEAEGRSSRLDDATRRWYESRAEQTDRLDLAIVDQATDGCVGEVVLNDWRKHDDACNFRILIGAAGRNRGIGSEATRMVLDYTFQATNLNRIELEVYAFNPRARHVYERNGFVYEGRRRAALKFDGDYVDAIVMSVLRSDRE